MFPVNIFACKSNTKKRIKTLICKICMKPAFLLNFIKPKLQENPNMKFS